MDERMLKEKLQKVGKRGLALDIDDTLSKTGWHWMDELNKKFGNPENLSVNELHKKYKYVQHVPSWQEGKPLEWYTMAIDSADIYEAIPLIEDAHTTVQQIHQIIPIVAYITARPEAVRGGTERWLAKHNFPEADLILRPNDIPLEGGASHWKTGILEYLYPEIIGIIDDNPGLVKVLPKTYQGRIYFYNVDQHETANSNIVCCKDWSDILTHIKNQ
jgi:hypothetical protein